MIKQWCENEKDEAACANGEMDSNTHMKRFGKRWRKFGPCAMCDKLGTMRCGKCKQVHYCGRECQRQHWAAHKQECAGCERKRND